MRSANSQEPSSFGDAIVRQSIVVPLAPINAFRLWTEQIDLWWPAGHSRSGDPETQIVIEPKIGGRFYERTGDGTEYDWGTVLIWQPPTHLAYHWYLGSGPTQPTRVDVYFSANAAGETLVQVEHRGPELIGDLWWQNNSRYQGAWEVVLPAYARSASKHS